MKLVQQIKKKFTQDLPALYLRPLRENDLPAVMAIEKQVYHFPWSQQIFSDCLLMGYSSWALIYNEELIGYAILSVAVGEAHILNISIQLEKQSQGYGRFFLKKLFVITKEKQAEHVFLEVRPSNKAAVVLYEKLGFKQVGLRKGYYPSDKGREDARVYSYDLNV